MKYKLMQPINIPRQYAPASPKNIFPDIIFTIQNPNTEKEKINIFDNSTSFISIHKK